MHRRHSVVATLLRLSQTIESQLETLLQPLEIGLTDVRLLTLISQLDRASQKILAQKMGLSQVVISTRLDRLERMKYVVRKQAMGRLVACELTPLGAQLVLHLSQVFELTVPYSTLGQLDRGALDRLSNVMDTWMHLMQGSETEPEVTDIPAPLEPALQRHYHQMPEAVERLRDELDILNGAFVLLDHSRRRSKTTEK